MKCYEQKINTNFHSDKKCFITKEGFQCSSLPLALIDLVYATDKNFYP